MDHLGASGSAPGGNPDHDEWPDLDTGEPDDTRPIWQRRRTAIAATVVLLLVTPVAYQRWWPDDSSRRLGADEALDRYRASTTTAEPDATVSTTVVAPDLLRVPAPGVYRYATTGAETTDVLGGAEHTYPSETLITVTPDGCGVLLRWDLLAERWDEWRLCTREQGIVWMPDGATYHEFFGSGRREAIACDREVLIVPVDPTTGSPASPTCTIDGRLWLPEWRIVGTDEMVVDGTAVTVTHVQMTVTNDSEHYEYTTADWWFDDSGLPVRMTMEKRSNTDSGVIGDVVYTERYDATLLSREPLT